MATILRFILFFLLAPVFSVVAQAAGSGQDDFCIVGTAFHSERTIQDGLSSSQCNYDSSGALLQQRRSLDGKADDDDQIGHDSLETTGAELSLFAFFAEFVAAKNTETVQRAMSRAELSATQSTGLLRGGRSGTHHVSDAVNSSAGRAQQRLALPQTPEVRVTIEVPGNTFSPPTRVQPNFNMPGGGMERTATGNIPVRILRVDDL